MGRFAESYGAEIFQFILPDQLYVPGMGILVGLGIIFLAGIAVNAWFVQKLLTVFEDLISKIPLVKTIYNSIQDMMSFFSKGEGEQFSKVVMVTVGDTNIRLIGFVTRDNFDELCPEMGGEKDIAVYLPLSYQIGGYTVVVPEENVQPVDIPLDEAMKFALTAGVKRKRSNGPPIKDFVVEEGSQTGGD